LIEKQNLGEEIHEESHQVHEEEQELPHESVEEKDLRKTHHVEGEVHEGGPIDIIPPSEYESLVFAPPTDEDEVCHSDEDQSMEGYTPSQFFDVAFHDLKSEEFMGEPLNIVNFSSNKEHDDCIEDFIHIGRHGWDVSCFSFDGDPIYVIDDDSKIKNT